MNHNPIPTDKLHVQKISAVFLTEVLDAIGHSELDTFSAFRGVTWGDSAYTLYSPMGIFRMIDDYLSDDADQTYTDEQSDRLLQFFLELDRAEVYIDMEG